MPRMGGSPRNTRMRARSSVPVAALQPASSSAAFASIQAIKDMQSATPNLEYPVELIMPRNKPGEVGPREPVVITLPVLCQLFHEPLSIASAKIVRLPAAPLALPCLALQIQGLSPML
mmetsp:Transcript_9175/g.22754  ORF Transcript_9175/g.22754 Transcript_9175/m.22754 type:complete len:118 (-) Transcript_9175:296-649(-)